MGESPRHDAIIALIDPTASLDQGVYESIENALTARSIGVKRAESPLAPADAEQPIDGAVVVGPISDSTVTAAVDTVSRNVGPLPIAVIDDGIDPDDESVPIEDIEAHLRIANVDEAVDTIAGAIEHLVTDTSKTLLRIEHLESLIDDIDDVLWMFTPDWDELIYVNEAYERIWGQSITDLHHDPTDFLAAVHPDDVDDVEKAMETLTSGESVELEIRVNEANAYSRWVWIKGHPVYDESNEIVAVAGVCRDITDRQSELDTHQRQRDRFQRLFQHLPEPTIAYTFDDGVPIIQAVNDAFVDTVGYAEEEIIGKSVDDVLVSDARLEEARDIDRRIRSGELVDAEVIRSTRDGDRHFRFRNITLPEDDEFDGFGIYSDIDELKQRERTLNALNETSRELVMASDKVDVAERAITAAERILGISLGGIWLYNDEEHLLEPVAITKAGADAFEESPTFEPEGSIAWQVFSESTPQLFEDVSQVEQRFNPETPIRSEVVLPLGDHGVLIAGSTEIGAFSDLEVSFLQILAANTEVALSQADREETLRQQRQELYHQNQRLEEFTSVVSHDLRTPLSVATGWLEQLQEQYDGPEVDHIEQALSRMDDIIGKTLTLAQSGRSVGTTEEIKLKPFAEECLVGSGLSHIELVADDAPTVRADPDRLRHVFENLFRNAVEHGGDDVTITIDGIESGFAVSDDGPGIPSEIRDDVFDAGFSTADNGSGFGLTIIRRIAEAHGWNVSITTNDEGGTTFEFTEVEVLDRPINS